MWYLDFWTRISELFTFFRRKVPHFDLTKNNMAALNKERLAKILNPSNVIQHTRQCKLQFLVCGFPWKTRCSYNLSLVVMGWFQLSFDPRAEHVTCVTWLMIIPVYFPLSYRRWQFEKGCVISSFWSRLLSPSSRKQGKLVFGKKHYGTTLCKFVEILHRCRWVLTSIRDLQILRRVRPRVRDFLNTK